MKKENLYKLFVECYMIIVEVQNSTSEINEDYKEMNLSQEDIERFVDMRPSTVEYIISVNNNYRKLSDLLARINFNFNCKNKTAQIMSKYFEIILNTSNSIAMISNSMRIESAGIKDADDISRRYVETDTDLVWNVQRGFYDLHLSTLDHTTNASMKFKYNQK